MTLEETIKNLSEGEAKDMLLTIIVGTHSLVQWPHSQEYMEEEWFDKEAVAALGSEDMTGPSAYFIPTLRLIVK